MKLTLDCSAVERLIGNDTEAEIELRNCIVQEFAKKYLKTIANSEVVKEVGNTISKGIKEEVEKQVGTYNYSYTKLAPKIEEKIKSTIEKEVYSIINTKVTELTNYVNEYLEACKPRYTSYIDKKIKEIIDEEITKSVEEKFKKTLKSFMENK